MTNTDKADSELAGEMALTAGATLIEHVPVVLVSADGVMRWASSAFCDLTGQQRSALLGKPYAVLCDDEHDAAFLNTVWSAVARGRSWKGEIPYRSRDGVAHCASVHIVPLPEGAGAGPACLAIHVDVTGIRRLRQSLREKEQRYQDLVQMSPDGLFLSEDGAITFVNSAGSRLLRADDPADVIGKPALDLFPVESHAAMRQRFAGLQAGSAEPITSEETLLTFDGTQVPVEIRALAYRVQDRLIIQSSFRDISERQGIEDRLRQERDYADAVLDCLPGVFYHYNDAMQLVRWNRSHEEITGYSAAELAGTSPGHFLEPEHKALLPERIQELFEKGETRIEADYVFKDGQRVPFLFTGVRFEHDGKPGFVGIGTDLTDRKQMEVALRMETALFEAQVESSSDGILVVDRNGRKVIQNQRMADLWRIPPDIAADPSDARQLAVAIQQTRDPQAEGRLVAWLHQNPLERIQDEVELKDGTILERYSGPVQDKEGRYYGRIWAFRDVTDRRQAEARIRYLATHDELTGLPNRNLLRERIDAAIALARETRRMVALLYVDLDRFKIINDGYGHPFGDAVLATMGARLRGMVRESDTVARYGGDEFLILLPELRERIHAERIAQKILDSMVRSLEVEGRIVHLSGSIGVSLYPEDGLTADELIGNADVAMYRAKSSGRNICQFFTRAMSEETQDKLDLETFLRGAAQAGQLQLVYQPKVNLETGRISGCEALMRWHHPELGQVPPSRFIPVAEESGLIVPIGDWALRTACLQARAWLDAGMEPVSVAVNVSARQFLRQDVVAWVLGTLQETGLPASHLELELTESLIAQDVEMVIASIGELKAAGVRLSIDDFGTGYSSLSYLRRFHVDTLKIDQSFVRNMLVEQEDATIVRAVIALAHNLGFKVIAEGVETEPHCRFLRDNGCDEMQGYYFSKPVPAADFEAMMRRGQHLA